MSTIQVYYFVFHYKQYCGKQNTVVFCFPQPCLRLSYKFRGYKPGCLGSPTKVFYDKHPCFKSNTVDRGQKQGCDKI